MEICVESKRDKWFPFFSHEMNTGRLSQFLANVAVANINVGAYSLVGGNCNAYRNAFLLLLYRDYPNNGILKDYTLTVLNVITNRPGGKNDPYANQACLVLEHKTKNRCIVVQGEDKSVDFIFKEEFEAFFGPIVKALPQDLKIFKIPHGIKFPYKFSDTDKVAVARSIHIAKEMLKQFYMENSGDDSSMNELDCRYFQAIDKQIILWMKDDKTFCA